AESTADVDGGAGGMVDPLEEDAVEAPDSGSAEEQAAVSGPDDAESELAPGTGSDEESAAGSDQVPGTGSEPAPVAGTPAVPTPAATQAPTGFETIVVGGRTLTHADFNIPDDIAASDEETIARWMEDNMDLVLESEGMIYLVDLMMDYLEAGDLDGLAGLIREMSVSDPAAGEELILWMYELFAWPGGFEEWPVGEEIFPAPPATEPAPAVSPASVEVAPAALVPAAKQADQADAPVAAPSGELAETGASGTIWLASGGAGVLLLGVALVALRRRMA
ncbi:MAG TPA: LPXTG cell wall anchor domain-containing protein, partial [Arthrobacter sp.]|nr:LPXTG cell wall anchor domain-containing protein [Arthrobacter sp.]